jgi:hypothetical protein
VARLACTLALCLAAAPVRVGAAAPPAVAADESTTLVWPPALHGVIGAQAQGSVRTALLAGVSRTRLKFVEAPGDVPPCTDLACYREAARARGAGHVLVLDVTAVDRDYNLRLELIDVETGEVKTLREGCSICGLEDACKLADSLGTRIHLVWQAARDEAAARRLRDEQARRVREQDAALREQPRLRVASSPSGAAVLVDGEAVGRTPVEHAVTSGRHVVELRLRGHVAERREVEAIRGTTVPLDVVLRPGGKLPPNARSRAMLISGVSLAGAGGVGLGLMAYGLAAGASADREGERRVAELAAMGVAGLDRTDALADVRARGRRADAVAFAGGIAGGVLLVVGVALAVASTTPAVRRVALAPWGGRGSAGLTLVGRF